MGSVDHGPSVASEDLFADHPHTTDPILQAIAYTLFPDIVLENGYVAPRNQDRQALVRYGGALLRYLADTGDVGLEELTAKFVQHDQQGEQ